MNPDALKNYMRLDAAAEALGRSRRQLNRWLAERTWEAGFLTPVLRLSHKTVLVPRKGVAELAALRKQLEEKR